MQQKKTIGAGALLLLVALLLLGALLYLAAEPTPEPTPTAAPTPEPTLTPTPAPTPTAAPTSGPTPLGAPPPEPAETDPAALLKRYRLRGEEARPEIEAGLSALSERDPAAGKLWTVVFQEMFYVNQDPCVGMDLPTGLPEDDSLCIVVFGYELSPHGGMRAELRGRCELALACAEAWPRARIALTGGHTASENRSVSEAGAMARYLTEHGVAEERLIPESRSITTAENAVFLARILTESYPQINSLVIVSSDYHAPLCGLLMTETALIDEYQHGGRPYEVVAELGFPAPARGDFKSPRALVEYVLAVARSMGAA